MSHPYSNSHASQGSRSSERGSFSSRFSQHSFRGNFIGSANSSFSLKNSNYEVTKMDENFEATNDEFIVLNDIHHPQELEERTVITRHESGYPLAIKHLCKIVRTDQLSVQMAGGFYVNRRGLMVVNRGSSKTIRKKYVDLIDGKLRVYSLKSSFDPANVLNTQQLPYKDNDEMDIDFLEKEITFPMQRIRSIDYPTLKSTSFTLVFIKPKTKGTFNIPVPTVVSSTLKRMKSVSKTLHKDQASSTTPKNASMNTIAAAKRMKEKGKERQTGNTLFRLPLHRGKKDKKDKAKKHLRAENADTEPTTPMLGKHPSQNRLPNPHVLKSISANNISGMSTTSHESFNSADSFVSTFSNVSRNQFRPLERSFNSNMSVRSVNNHEVTFHPQVVESGPKGAKGNSMMLIDEETNQLVQIEEETVEFKFDTPEECQDWLKYILIELENLAIFFNACVNVLSVNQEGKQTAEMFMRYAVDLLTLSKGVRNYDVWRLREKLANFLEEKGDTEEAKMWFELSQNVRSKSTVYNYRSVAGSEDDSSHGQTETRPSAKSRNSANSFKIYTPGLRTDSTTVSGNTQKTKDSEHSFNSHRISLNVTDREKYKKKKPKTRDDALKILAEFLEQYGSKKLLNGPMTEAKVLFKKYELSEVAKRVECEYGRVPEGFEYFLLESTKDPLEILQQEAEGIKKVEGARIFPTLSLINPI